MSDDPTRVSDVFCSTLVVQPEAIDGLGHVSNVQYVQWIQDVAQAHSERVGYGREAYFELGAVFVVHRHEVDYLRPAYEGDELELRTWIEKWSAATSMRQTTLTRASDGEEIVRAVTTWALVSVDGGRPRRITKTLRVAFAAAEES